ncbi:hypothetical protein ACFSUS_10660 [Spirosoma soli]|uniref:Plasmid stabilization protein n=1 Tax=Spirosoma soli TaxID=1770529 RepID=A0ABW5M3F6_9BACT
MSVVITFNQLAKLASQLPPAEKRRLAKKLEQEANQEESHTTDNVSAESQLTPAQRKTRKNIRQGFEELKQIREGKAKARPLKDLLDEL